MPLPTPNKKEKKSEFIQRCMANPTSNKDFPDNEQRYAVCQSKWEDKKKKSKASVELSNGDELLID